MFSQNQINKKSQAEKAGYSGPIKKVTQNCYKAKKKSGEIIPDTKIEDRTHLNFVVHYNINGNATESIYYEADGMFDYKITNEYDSLDNLRKSTVASFFDQIKQTEFYTYDLTGNCIEYELKMFGDSLIASNNYEFDSNGYLIKEFNYRVKNVFGGIDVNSIETCNATMTYDKKGNMIEKHCRMNGELVGKFENLWVYDDKHQPIKRVRALREGNLYYEGTYSYPLDTLRRYDNIGNKTEENNGGEYVDTWVYDAKGNMIKENKGTNRISWKYDAQGNKIEEESTGYLFHRYLMQYDNNGNLIAEQHYNFSKKIYYKAIYEYDRHGNCTKKIEYKKNRPKKITIIKYEYYE